MKLKWPTRKPATLEINRQFFARFSAFMLVRRRNICKINLTNSQDFFEEHFMAGYSFQDITIAVFDIHTTIEPHLPKAPGFFQKEFRFLQDAKSYNSRYQSCNALTTPSFIFDNLPGSRLAGSHFWQNYIRNLGSAKLDYWKLQLPLRGRLKNSNIKLNLSDMRIERFSNKLQSQIYLSPLGWSTILVIRLRDNDLIPHDLVIEAMATLSGKANRSLGASIPLPFLLENEPKSLTDIFKFYQGLIFEEVYTKENPPHPSMKFPRHFEVSLNKFEGDLIDYDDMAQADKGVMLSFLYGENIDGERVAHYDTSKLLTTKISGPNFALTDFDRGILIFPQKEAQNSERQTAVHCLATNVRDMMLMAYSLMNFYKLSKDSGKQSRITSLRKFAKANLQRMQKQYPNQVCQNLFQYHNSLSEIIA